MTKTLLKGFIKFEFHFNQALINNEPHHLGRLPIRNIKFFNSSIKV